MTRNALFAACALLFASRLFAPAPSQAAPLDTNATFVSCKEKLTNVRLCPTGDLCSSVKAGTIQSVHSFPLASSFTDTFDENTQVVLDIGGIETTVTLSEDPKYVAGATRATVRTSASIGGKSVIVATISLKWGKGRFIAKAKARTGTGLPFAPGAADNYTFGIYPPGDIQNHASFLTSVFASPMQVASYVPSLDVYGVFAESTRTLPDAEVTTQKIRLTGGASYAGP